MQLTRLVARARRSARLPGNRPSPHATPPIANIPSGQASIQISDVIIAVGSFGCDLRPNRSSNYRSVVAYERLVKGTRARHAIHRYMPRAPSANGTTHIT